MLAYYMLSSRRPMFVVDTASTGLRYKSRVAMRGVGFTSLVNGLKNLKLPDAFFSILTSPLKGLE